MVIRLPSLTFNTHLANFLCSSKLATMTRMLIWKWRIITCYQRCNRGNKTLTMSFHLPLGIKIGKICGKSPPRTTVFPPKIFSIVYASSNCIKVCKVQSTAWKVQRCSLMLHPKWSYQLYTPTWPLSFVVWCYKSTHPTDQLESWILNG